MDSKRLYINPEDDWEYFVFRQYQCMAKAHEPFKTTTKEEDIKFIMERARAALSGGDIRSEDFSAYGEPSATILSFFYKTKSFITAREKATRSDNPTLIAESLVKLDTVREQFKQYIDGKKTNATSPEQREMFEQAEQAFNVNLEVLTSPVSPSHKEVEQKLSGPGRSH